MHRRDDGQPTLAPQSVNQFQRLLLMTDIERRSGFIEQDHRCLLGKGSGDDDSLPFSAAQRGERSVAVAAHIEPFEDVACDEAIGGGLATKARNVRGAAQQCVLKCGHPRRQNRILRRIGNEPGAFSNVDRRQIGAVDADSSLMLHEAKTCTQQRGLACTVRADQTHPLAGGDPVGNVDHRRARGVGHRH